VLSKLVLQNLKNLIKFWPQIIQKWCPNFVEFKWTSNLKCKVA
jgi:hypothetical protein